VGERAGSVVFREVQFPPREKQLTEAARVGKIGRECPVVKQACNDEPVGAMKKCRGCRCFEEAKAFRIMRATRVLLSRRDHRAPLLQVYQGVPDPVVNQPRGEVVPREPHPDRHRGDLGLEILNGDFHIFAFHVGAPGPG